MLWVTSMRVPAGCFSSICHEGDTRFSTLKINGQVYDAFRACGSHAEPNNEQLICLHHIPQFLDMQMTKNWAGLEMKLFDMQHKGVTPVSTVLRAATGIVTCP